MHDIPWRYYLAFEFEAISWGVKIAESLTLKICFTFDGVPSMLMHKKILGNFEARKLRASFDILGIPLGGI